jgi:hypothetical protein
LYRTTVYVSDTGENVFPVRSSRDWVSAIFFRQVLVREINDHGVNFFRKALVMFKTLEVRALWYCLLVQVYNVKFK